jgi:hypothetical protein
MDNCYRELEDGTIEMKFTLTREQYEGLIMLLGMAVATTIREGWTELTNTALRIANKINSGNPNWSPYWTPPEPPHGAESTQHANPQGH